MKKETSKPERNHGRKQGVSKKSNFAKKSTSFSGKSKKSQKPFHKDNSSYNAESRVSREPGDHKSSRNTRKDYKGNRDQKFRRDTAENRDGTDSTNDPSYKERRTFHDRKEHTSRNRDGRSSKKKTSYPKKSYSDKKTIRSDRAPDRIRNDRGGSDYKKNKEFDRFREKKESHFPEETKEHGGKHLPAEDASESNIDLFIPKKKNIIPRKDISASDALDILSSSMNGSFRDAPAEKESFRINRYLAHCGFGSRREVEDFILQGRVKVNDRVIRSLDTKVQPGDVVHVEGKLAVPPTTFRYIALNKPSGYTVSKRAFPGQPGIYSLLPENLKNVKYAGRLDLNSRGLLILSDDGDFLQAITHPSKRISKKYKVTLNTLPDTKTLEISFYKGVVHDGELLRALRVSVIDTEKKIVEVVLGQGKNRQIRRMFESLGVKVLDLYRTSIGQLDIEDLHIKEGSYAFIEPDQIFLKKKKSADVLMDFNPYREDS